MHNENIPIVSENLSDVLAKSRMTLIENLNFDLSKEYSHMIYYVHCSSLFFGPDGLELKSYFSKKAKEEMSHIEMFSSLIISYGFSPVYNHNLVPNHSESIALWFSEKKNLTKIILNTALDMEAEAVDRYVKRLEELNSLKIPVLDKIYLKLFYEKQLEHSHADVIELSKIVIID